MSNKNLLLPPGRGLSSDETGAVTPLLKALADPVRLRLLSEVAAHPGGEQAFGEHIGIGLALILRLGLLSTVAFIVQLTAPVFSVFGKAFSWRDIILIAGGLFLLWKATKEIHHTVDPEPETLGSSAVRLGFTAAIGQILVLDLVFSIDSIITAVGMTEHVPIMVIAVVTASMPLAQLRATVRALSA